MFAKSEKITGVGGEHIPLFAKQTPLPVTVSGKASGGVKQYQLCHLKNDGTVSIIDNLVGVQALSNDKQLCISAFAAKNGEPVSVYTHGTFNINALVFGTDLFSGMDTVAQKLEKLRMFKSSVIFFENCETNPVQRT
jgi:hypothetical protein